MSMDVNKYMPYTEGQNGEVFNDWFRTHYLQVLVIDMGTRLFPCAPLNKGIKESKTFTSSQWIRPCHEVLLSALVRCNPFSTGEMLQN